jgi:hypothetical protein
MQNFAGQKLLPILFTGKIFEGCKALATLLHAVLLAYPVPVYFDQIQKTQIWIQPRASNIPVTPNLENTCSSKAIFLNNDEVFSTVSLTLIELKIMQVAIRYCGSQKIFFRIRIRIRIFHKR